MEKQSPPLNLDVYEAPAIGVMSITPQDVICASAGINLPDVSLEIFGENEIL